ncbi:MAG: hypothetical protein K9I82_01825 [Chitinophagaceae bacterium]|nr:hypothetical protein [Chitinophagaceae bacterium]
MKNIDELILRKIYDQYRMNADKTIFDEGWKVYTKLTVKLWDPSWLQVDNGMAQLVIMQIKNKLNYEEH